MQAKTTAEDFMIPSGDAGIELFVRNKRPADAAQLAPEKILLYVHGTSQAAEATFDLALDGASWMDYLAERGWDVYLVDLRGYGRSTRPPEMRQPPSAIRPSSRPMWRCGISRRRCGSCCSAGRRRGFR